MGCALAAYERPVARRWRRAIAIVRWEARLRKWRVPFVEAWLRPGGSGARSLAKRFAEHASVHHHNTNPRTVKCACVSGECARSVQ